MSSPFKKVVVIGAGTMGSGIAQVCAQHGYQTLLYDINSDILDTAREKVLKNLDKGIEKGKVTADQKEKTLSNLGFSNQSEDLEADLIIEAIVEKEEVKIKLFRQLEEINSKDSVLASNTSSIPITKMAASLKYPHRLIGLHFFNPAHIMKLVEVIRTDSSKEEMVNEAVAFVKSIKKVPALVKDSPGFIVNRVARHFYTESLKVVEENVADFATVDEILEETGFKMGPYRLMDLIGIDVNFKVTESLFTNFYQEARFRPSRVQAQKIYAGHLGRKSGKGFYSYEE